MKFWNYFVFDIIEKNLINKNIRFKMFSSCFIYNIRRKDYERMFKMKISDNLYGQRINISYTHMDKYYYRKIIDKIYEEKKEINIIKILELTFEELFIIFRRKLNDPEDIEKLKEIKNKIKGLDLLENNNYKDIENILTKYSTRMDESESDEYIKIIKKYCLEYENLIKRKAIKQRKCHHHH